MAAPKPIFHVAPPSGWLNDPNGPIFYGGYYHMFYQYVERGCNWSWGLLWGHAVSRDLVHWEHLPPALAPTYGGFDGDGCFSGCATLDSDGTPTILYTGVRLRSSEVAGPMPPPECDLGTACIETQCVARGDAADPKLTHWTKDEMPFLALPPPNMNLTAWRDPFVIGRPGDEGGDGRWTIMIGAGVKDQGGSALVYRTDGDSLRDAKWQYAGELCRGSGDTGIIWECPVMAPLPLLPDQLRSPNLLTAAAAAAAAAAAPHPAGVGEEEAEEGAGAAVEGAAAQRGAAQEALDERRADELLERLLQQPPEPLGAAPPHVLRSPQRARTPRPSQHPSQPPPQHPRVELGFCSSTPASPRPAIHLVASSAASSFAPIDTGPCHSLSPYPAAAHAASSPTWAGGGAGSLGLLGGAHYYEQPADDHFALPQHAQHAQHSGSATRAGAHSRAGRGDGGGNSGGFGAGLSGLLAAMLSPRRPAPASAGRAAGVGGGAWGGLSPAAPLSPLRSPVRLGVPRLTSLAYAPSPPAPQPGSSSPLLTTAAAAPLPPLHPPGPAALHAAPLPDPSVLPPAATFNPAGVPPASASASALGAAAHPTATPTTATALLDGTILASDKPALPSLSTPAPVTKAPATPTAPTATDAAARSSSSTSWQRHATFFCICPDDCRSMAMYYLGAYDPRVAAFDLEGALGPFPVDLGDIFYAPNTLNDPQGRALLWGWLQEKPRAVGAYDYAGCLTMPRLMYLEVEDVPGSEPAVHLAQHPPPEISQLRVPGSGCSSRGLVLEPGVLLPLPLHGDTVLHLEVDLTMLPAPPAPAEAGGGGEGAASRGAALPAGARVASVDPRPGAAPEVAASEATSTAAAGEESSSSSTTGPAGPATGAAPLSASTSAATASARAASPGHCSGLLLHSWSSGPQGAAALLYHWDSGLLEVVFEALDPATLTFSLAAPGARRVGGVLRRPPAPGQPLALRVFLDCTVLEVFTEGGEVLTTRVYRGVPPHRRPHGPMGHPDAHSRTHGSSPARSAAPYAPPASAPRPAPPSPPPGAPGLAPPSSSLARTAPSSPVPSSAAASGGGVGPSAGVSPAGLLSEGGADLFPLLAGSAAGPSPLRPRPASTGGGSAALGGLGSPARGAAGGGAGGAVPPSVELVSFGERTEFVRVEAHEMRSAWVDEA